VVTPSAQPSAVDVNAVNPGGVVDRELCLTISAGPAAAYECGDLRLVHPLPTTRTLNKARTPMLLYNSQTAHPHPLIAANVTLPTGATVPDSVTGTVTIGGVTSPRTKWLGNQWAPGQTRRLVLGFDGLNTATALLSYTVEFTNWYPSPTDPQPTTVTGELAIVNRDSSAFGAGWWLAGLERLFSLPDGRKLVVLGDGSVRVYATVGTNLYTAPNPSRPDTLDGRGADYVRLAPHGVRVHYSAATGRHTTTINRLGHVTAFNYDNCGRLSAIKLPPDTTSRVYTFTYTSPTDCTTRLASVTAPPNGAQGRVTTVTNTAGRVTGIGDPDTRTVGFAYDPGFANRIISRTDKRANTTFYAFDVGAKLTMDSLPLETGQTPIVQRFRPVESLGLAAAIDTAAAYTRLDGPRTDVSDTTVFWLDRFGAPRRIVDALGYETLVKREDSSFPALVTELRAPNGFVTRAKYDARGNVDTLIQVNPLSDGQDAVTRYHWDQRWDFVDSIVTPLDVKTTMAYDATNGNRLWQQLGSDQARRVTFLYETAQKLLVSTVLPQTPADSIVYDGAWNVAATRTPRRFWTSYYKDAVGRDTLVVAPIDSMDKARGGPEDATIRMRQRTVFTVMDRDSITEAIAPNALEKVRVDKRYDPVGNLLSLARRATPDPAGIDTIKTQWRYDRANRKVAEVAPDGMVDSTDYDPASNVVNALTRRKNPTGGARLTINMTYDARNLLVNRVLPSITYQSRPTGIQIQNNGYNWTALPFAAYNIPSETHTFTYDAAGRLLTAENADAKVKRSYYPNGLIQTDSLRIQTVARDNWETHKYGVRYGYDLDGRRDSLFIPQQLRAGNDTTITYAYDPQLGVLQTLRDLQRNSYTFGYTLQGDLSSITYPGSYSEGLGYNSDGQLAIDTIKNNGSATYPRIQSAPFVRNLGVLYDGRQKLLVSGDAIQLKDTLRPTYSGLGNLKSTYWTEHGCDGCQISANERHATIESFPSLDAFANVIQSQTLDSMNGQTHGVWGDEWHYQSISTSCCDTWTYQPGTGRMLTMTVAQAYPRTFYYDSAGNQEFSSSVDPANVITHPATERAAFYAADGSLRMVDARSAYVTHPFAPGEWQSYVVEDYRYDALGRRVWVRSRKWCDSSGKDWPAATECKVGLLRRTIWDGDMELAEIQMPWALQVTTSTADTTQYPALWENDVTPLTSSPLPLMTIWSQVGDPNPYFGHVIYAGRRGIDQPIAITRVNYVMRQDWQWRDPQHSYNPPRLKAPFTIAPFWNPRGDAPVGVFSTGEQFSCGVPHIYPAGYDTACVAIRWPFNWSSSDRNGGLPHDYWHGTLLEGKRDESGFRYMRNRYYDPLTGRFTQEDPIGLAGGLNAYGFAEGDPINFSDPFGLHGCKEAGNVDHDDEEVIGHNPDGSPIKRITHVDCSKEREAAEKLSTMERWMAAITPDWLVPIGKCVQNSNSSTVLLGSWGVPTALAGGAATTSTTLNTGARAALSDAIATGSARAEAQAYWLAKAGTTVSATAKSAGPAILVGSAGFGTGYAVGALGACSFDSHYYDQ
jgi:RHS repeat-associated protein